MTLCTRVTHKIFSTTVMQNILYKYWNCYQYSVQQNVRLYYVYNRIALLSLSRQPQQKQEQRYNLSMSKVPTLRTYVLWNRFWFNNTSFCIAVVGQTVSNILMIKELYVATFKFWHPRSLMRTRLSIFIKYICLQLKTKTYKTNANFVPHQRYTLHKWRHKLSRI